MRMTGDAEKLLLAQGLIGELGLRWADVAAPRAIPTISEYLPRVIAAATPSQRDKYATYWNRALLLYGGHRLDALRVSDIVALQRESVGSALRRADSRNGRHAGEGCIRAMRFLYRLAIADGLLSDTINPAAKVPLPRRLPSLRRALTTSDPVLGPAAGEGRHRADAAHQPHPVHRAAHARREPRRDLTDRRTSAVRQPHTADKPTLRPPLDPHPDGTPLGRHTRRVHPLAAPHHTHLGRTPLQLRQGGSTLTYIKGVPREVATALSALTGETHPLTLTS
jgi:hypothetical protein